MIQVLFFFYFFFKDLQSNPCATYSQRPEVGVREGIRR